MKKFSKHWRYPLWLAAIVLAAWWLFFGYRYGFIYNEGQSMEPTHSNGDILIIEKTRFLGKDWKPDRTDVVVIKDKESGDNLTKRVIALEGEIVSIKNGYILINGKKAEDRWGKGNIIWWQETEGERAEKPKREWLFLNANIQSVKVPKGCVWVIGDNREISWYGVLPIEEIKGIVIL